MKLRSTLLVVVLSAACTEKAAEPAPAPAPAPAPVPAVPTGEARGPAAAAKLKGTLVAGLQKQIAEKGAVGAVTACGEIAAQVKVEVEKESGVKIGRTSSRLRNPQNTTPAWAQPILAEMENDKAARTPRSIKLEGGGAGYVEPLLTMPLCVQCHGTAIAPDVQAALAARYPDDKATGFAEGDLRGLLWVELP